MTVQEMIKTHPPPTSLDRDALLRCIDHWVVADDVRAGAAVGIGAAAGLLVLAFARALRAWEEQRHAPSAAH